MIVDRIALEERNRADAVLMAPIDGGLQAIDIVDRQQYQPASLGDGEGRCRHGADMPDLNHLVGNRNVRADECRSPASLHQSRYGSLSSGLSFHLHSGSSSRSRVTALPVTVPPNGEIRQSTSPCRTDQ